jgi:hypothetical protein
MNDPRLPGFYGIQTEFGNWVNKKHPTTLCRLGLGLGHPRAAQASPKRLARVAQASICGPAFVFNKSWKKAGWGGAG